MSETWYADDRRQSPRFVPAGVLAATVELKSRVVLEKIGRTGAVVGVQLVPDLKALRFAQLILNDLGERLNAWVRRLEPLTGGPEENRYRIALEFVHLSRAGHADLHRIFSQDERGPFRDE